MKLIDKSAVVAEIKSRIKESEKLADVAADNNLHNTLEANELLIRQYTSLLSFLDSLEVKDVGLEKETKKWWKERLHLNPENQLWMDAHQSLVFAKHFFELGINARKGNKL